MPAGKLVVFDQETAWCTPAHLTWNNAIKAFNTPDLSRLSRGIFDKYDMYVGIRDREEFLAAKHLADLSIWVDASERVTQEDPTIKIFRTDADVIIDNNTSEEDLRVRLKALFDLLIGQK